VLTRYAALNFFLKVENPGRGYEDIERICEIRLMMELDISRTWTSDPTLGFDQLHRDKEMEAGRKDNDTSYYISETDDLGHSDSRCGALSIRGEESDAILYRRQR
jgi:hypothetical protein